MKRPSMFGGDTGDVFAFKERKPDDSEIDVTPLVDCVFLLLSFFILTSPMKGNPDRNVPAAANGVGVNPLGVMTIRVSGTGDSPKILLERREVRLEDVRPFVEDEVKRGHRLAVIKADGTMPVGFVQKVVQEVTSVEGVKYSFGVRDKR
jgi:biopolymer transport protein ExbD